MTFPTIVAIAFLLGVQHATEADHLAAVTTLATRQGSLGQTLKQGVAWGIGHALTLMLFGGTVLFLGKSIPRHMEQMLELAVGLMLIALGAEVLHRLARHRSRFPAHTYGKNPAHDDARSHAGEGAHRLSPHHHGHIKGWSWLHRGTGPRRTPRTDGDEPSSLRAIPLRSLAVGMMHGMAGSAALILLSLGAVHSWSMGLIYIALFGAGSITGMALFSLAIAIPLRLSAGYLGWLHKSMTGLAGGFSCMLGGFTVYRIGFLGG